MLLPRCLRVFKTAKVISFRCCSTASKAEDPLENDGEFRVYEIYPTKDKTRSQRKSNLFKPPVLPPREKSMPIDQDWPSVWPTAKSFRPSVIPLPVHQGYQEKKVAPGKYANAELMKIPNFFHLTPPAIERHCEALKKFCTPWPKGLDTEEDCMKHFPLEVITSDYCHSSPTIRDERARIVTIKFQLSSLDLDYHGRDKFKRLVTSDRYNPKTDVVTIVADRCPLRRQNYDYLLYLMSALYHESQITEPWELTEKTEVDMEKFFFEDSRHEKCIIETINSIAKVTGDQVLSFEEMKTSETVVRFSDVLVELINEGESPYTMEEYKKCVTGILKLKNLYQEELKQENVQCDS